MLCRRTLPPVKEECMVIMMAHVFVLAPTMACKQLCVTVPALLEVQVPTTAEAPCNQPPAMTMSSLKVATANCCRWVGTTVVVCQTLRGGASQYAIGLQESVSAEPENFYTPRNLHSSATRKFVTNTFFSSTCWYRWRCRECSSSTWSLLLPMVQRLPTHRYVRQCKGNRCGNSQRRYRLGSVATG